MDRIGQDQVCGVSINNLPPEMLQMILQNLDMSSLLACHLVSQKWNELANYILHDRPETELPFKFNPSTKKYQLVVKYEKNETTDNELKEERSLRDFFLECVNQSENSSSKSSPFARFALFNIQEWDESIINFLSAVSPIATCLKLEFARSAMEDPRLTDKLRNLLLHQTPKLKEFGLGFEMKDDLILTQIQKENLASDSNVLKLALFPAPPKENSTEVNFIINQPTSVKLPKLKVLQVGLGYEDDSTAEIVRDILRIAPNLEKIQYLVNDPIDYIKTPFGGQEDFTFFLECGKLNTFKHVCFDPSSGVPPGWENVPEKMKISTKKISSLFKIEYLRLYFDNSSNTKNPNEFRHAFHLLQQVCEGSKNSLKELEIFNFAFPPGFYFPTFTKLSTVEFNEFDSYRVKYDPLFPVGCRLLNIFPNVGTLRLDFHFSNYLKQFFPREDSTPLMPSVHTISFQGQWTKGEDVEVMALLCPNVKKLRHVNIYEEDKNNIYVLTVSLKDFPSFGLAVWKNMKNLESLHLVIDAGAEANKFPALDSTLTGISKENCHRLFEESTDADVENLDDENSTAKSQRESEMKKLKVNESILDLPKLKELVIKIEGGSDELQDGHSSLSRVSELYALKLMPGLNYKITGESHSYLPV